MRYLGRVGRIGPSRKTRMSVAVIRRELAADDVDTRARGLRRLSLYCGSSSVDNRRPADFAERRQSLADCEANLFDFARGEDEVMRELAADALGAWLGDQALAVLLELTSDPVERVRASAIGALEGWPDDSRVLDVLLNALDAPRWTVRMRAARALAPFQDPQADDGLLEALVDPDSYVRSGACDALQQRDPARYLERLRKLSDYPAPHLLDAAMDLLGAVGTVEDAKFLEKAGSWLNLSQPGFVRSWARKAARKIRKRQRA